MTQTLSPAEAVAEEGPALLIQTQALRAGYGRMEVLHGVDLAVRSGEAVALLGANGAGKTTLLRALTGQIPHRGAIRFLGQETGQAPTETLVRQGMALVPQGRGTFPELSVEDNLRLGAYTRPRAETARDLERWFTAFPTLRTCARQKAGALSGGQQQLLAVARALMSRPRLLLCDEPSLGLAPLVAREVFSTLLQLNRDEHLTMLVVEQNAQLALSVAQRGYVLEAGTLALQGTAADLRGVEAVRRAYLGE